MTSSREATSASTVVRTRGITKRFGRTLALKALDLEVPGGVVFGYLGPNGAGKTTTIRLLVGLLRPTAGRAEVLGLDVTRDREEIHRRTGYLPGEFVAYPDLTADQYLRYLAALRGGVEWSRIRGLAGRLELDLNQRIGSMSHGNRQKVGLVQAFMHDPEVLFLDEPSSGLDPLMQREFVAMVREAREAGRTVFLSSHILDEVEAVADLVGILRRGKLVVVEEMERLKARALRRMTLTFEGAVPAEALRRAAGVSDLLVEDNHAHLAVAGSMRELLEVAAAHRASNVITHEADLEDIFLAYYGGEGRGVS